MATYKFIDISEFQGNVNWAKVKAQGVEGVILRAGRRLIIDARFKQHIQGAIDSGMHIGIYWFSYAITVEMAKAEAEYCVEVLKPYREYIDCPVFFDWEYDSYDNFKDKTGKKPTKLLITNMNIEFCNTIAANGYMPGVYYNLDYKNNYLDVSRLKSYYQWFAYYSTVKKRTECDIQQYTSSGIVDGISGKVDRNYCYTEFWKIKSKAEIKTTKVSDTKMPKLKKGSKGKAVKIWQIIVGASPDGIFGDITEAKTKTYQKNHNLKVDGIVGDETWKSGLESVK